MTTSICVAVQFASVDEGDDYLNAFQVRREFENGGGYGFLMLSFVRENRQS